jgi:drug/metabolite transporter (DMT)-like permease
MNVSNPTQRPRGTRWCSVGSWIAGIGLVLAVAGVVGASAGALQPITAFSSFGIGMLLCLVALLPLVIGLLLSKGSGGSVAAARAWGALVAAGVLVAVSLTQYPAGDRAPPIHDVTTYLINPP